MTNTPRSVSSSGSRGLIRNNNNNTREILIIEVIIAVFARVVRVRHLRIFSDSLLVLSPSYIYSFAAANLLCFRLSERARHLGGTERESLVIGH